MNRKVFKVINGLMTRRQVGRLFGVSEQVVDLWRKDDELPFIVIPSDVRPTIRFSLDEVRQWAKAKGRSIRYGSHRVELSPSS